MSFERITVDSDVMGGTPCIRQSMVPVATVLAMLSDGMTITDIMTDVPFLEEEDIVEALDYAAEAVRRQAARPVSG
jgi:uncharacterized protein (DUF433 family)